MQYLQPFLYFARKPQTGYKNVLWLCLCGFVPYVGEMALLGYRARVSEALERDPDLKDHPDVKIDEATVYLMRGIWPFVTRLIFALLVIPIVEAFAFFTGFVVFQIVSEPILGIVAGGAVLLILMPPMMTILWPMQYYAQVTNKFAPLEEIKFAIRFSRVCWFSTLVAVLMFSMLTLVTAMLGMLFCIVGVIPAGVIINMAEQHIMSQLYLLYLEEGGEPIRRPEVLDDVKDDDEEPRRAFRAAEDE